MSDASLPSNDRLGIIKQTPRQASIDDIEWLCEEVERLTEERDQLRRQLLEHAEVCGESAYPISDRAAVETKSQCTDPGWEQQDGKLVCTGCGLPASDVFAEKASVCPTCEGAEEIWPPNESAPGPCPDCAVPTST